jgi:hypothetical protein
MPSCPGSFTAGGYQGISVDLDLLLAVGGGGVGIRMVVAWGDGPALRGVVRSSQPDVSCLVHQCSVLSLS